MMTLGEIAARAGVCITTARNALRLAAGTGSHDPGAAARSAAEPPQCRAHRLAGVASWIERGRKNERRPRNRRPRIPGGRVQKRGPRTKLPSEAYAETALCAVNILLAARKTPKGALRAT